MPMQASAGSIATGMGNNNPQMPRDYCGCQRSIQVCKGSSRGPWLRSQKPRNSICGIRDFKIVDDGRLGRLDAYTGDLGQVR